MVLLHQERPVESAVRLLQTKQIEAGSCVGLVESEQLLHVSLSHGAEIVERVDFANLDHPALRQIDSSGVVMAVHTTASVLDPLKCLVQPASISCAACLLL